MRQIFLLFASLIMCSAHAGPSTSGGGEAQVCRNSAGQILSAELYDLFEGISLYDLKIQRSDVDVDKQVASAIDRLNPKPEEKAILLAVASEIIGQIHWLAEGIRLQMPSDMGTENPILTKPGCAIEGAGYYDSDHRLQISRDVFTALSKTDQAALILHEALYKIMRRIGDTDSSYSRHEVAILFAQNFNRADIESLAATVALYFGPAPDGLLELPGPGPYPELSISVTPVLPAGKSAVLRVTCLTHYVDTAELQIAVEQDAGTTGNGPLYKTISGDNCLDLGVAVAYPAKSGGLPVDETPAYQLEVYSGKELVYQRSVSSGLGGVGLGSLVALSFLYPNLILPSVPIPFLK